MGLIASRRHTKRDLELWTEHVIRWQAHARLASFQRRVAEALAELESFAPQYVSTSWGKDSVVVASLAQAACPKVPLVWVRVEPIANPDCVLVRDTFLEAHPTATYDEIVVECTWGEGEWHASGTLEAGFTVARSRYGGRYASGIRGEESGMRKLRVAKHGLSSANTCAPIGRWTGDDVFAYLLMCDLPIHPAYACLMNGLLDPRRVRVASIGGQRGSGMGRSEWEQLYYADALREQQPISSMKRLTVS